MPITRSVQAANTHPRQDSTGDSWQDTALGNYTELVEVVVDEGDVGKRVRLRAAALRREGDPL